MQPTRRVISKEELRLPAQSSRRTNISHSSDHGSRNSPPQSASSPRVLNWTIARSSSGDGLPLRVYSGTLQCGDMCLSIAAAGVSLRSALISNRAHALHEKIIKHASSILDVCTMHMRILKHIVMSLCYNVLQLIHISTYVYMCT
jgi:hypothetical protein